MNSKLAATAWEAKADRTSSRTRNEMQRTPGAASTATPKPVQGDRERSVGLPVSPRERQRCATYSHRAQ